VNKSSICRYRSGVINLFLVAARASRQSLSTVTTETPSAKAVSGTVMPPKYRKGCRDVSVVPC
jgi:hypothetical protein